MDFPSSGIPCGDTLPIKFMTPGSSLTKVPYDPCDALGSFVIEGGMLIECEQCGATPNLVCVHTRDATFMACKSFKETIRSVRPCKNADEVIEISQEKIPDKLSDKFIAYKVSRDGNCFYSSVSVCLTKDPSIANCLRQAAALEFVMNPEICDMLTKRNIPADEILQAATNCVWANETSIYLVSAVIGKRIEVQHQICDSVWRSTFYDANPFGSCECIHVYLHEDHFSPLIPRNPDLQLPAALYSPGSFCHGNNSYFQSLLQRGKPLKIVDLSKESEEPCNGDNFATASKIAPARKPIQEFTYLMADMEGPLMYFDPKDYDFSGKVKKLNATLEDLESAETKEQYVEACRMHKIRSIPKMGHNEILNFSKNGQQQHFQNPKGVFHDIQDGTEVHTADGTKALKRFQTGSDGKFKPDLEAKFDSCLKSISEHIQYLQKNGSKEKEDVKKYILQCMHSRSHWIENPTIEMKLTKHQILRREKHSKVLLKMLQKPEYQTKFTRMITACGESHCLDWSKPINASMLSPVKSPTCTKPSVCTDSNCLSPPNELSEKLKSTQGNVIGMEAVADLLNVSLADLEYEPPTNFDICIDPEQLSDMYDFTTETFINRQWGKGISRALTSKQGACSFKAQRKPTYHLKESSSFATLEGKCGCGIIFVAQVQTKPVKDKPLQISVTTTGEFHLMQEKFTGRPLSGKERNEIAKRLQHVKAEAIFLEDTHHLSALRLLHGNQTQSSRHVLRKLKSEKKLENRLDPDPMKDLLKQQIQYETASHPKASVKGYIQYVNGSPGNFKVILFDQGSLSLHIDQAQRCGAIFYMDATGGVISKLNGKEVLLYRLLGRRIAGYTYEIAEMLSEKGTTVEMTDFLKRIKYGVMQIRPSFSRSMADMVVVDWSWPLLHAVANGWNTETIQDYVNRSFAVLSETNSEWGNKCCIFICTSHLINAFYRNLCKRLHPKGVKKSVMPYALASIARLQESFSLEEFRSVTRDITRLFGKKQLACSSVRDLCERLQEHKNRIDELTQKDIYLDCQLENNAAFEIATSTTQKLVREKSPFYHVFKMEREKQMQIKEDGAPKMNPFYCPVVLDVLEKDKVAMFPLWAAAVPRKVLGSNDFLRETNSTVESSFNQMKHLQSQAGRVLYSDFVKHRYCMHDGKNKDTLSKLVRLEVRESATEPPTQLLTEKWKKKGKKCGSHFSPKTPINITEKFSKSNNSKMSENQGQRTSGPVLYPEHGLPNIGNTCYLNAALQLLLSIPLLWHHTNSSSDAYHFLKFMDTRLRDPEMPSISMEIGKNMFTLVKHMLDESKVTGFELGTQHDATEFFRAFVNLPQMNKVKDKFEFSVVNSYFCSSCNYLSELPGVVISLDISIADGFVAGINNFLSNPEMSECSKCKNITLSHQVVLASKPQYLLITTDLLKGNLDERGNYTLKKAKSNNYFSRNLKVDNISYDLHGMICHRGIMANSGHYVAYLMKGNSLMCCDDDATILEVESPEGDIYMYMYRKVVQE